MQIEVSPGSRERIGRSLLTVGNLVAQLDVLLGVDDDLLLTLNGDDLRRTVRIARVVDQPSVNCKKELLSETTTSGELELTKKR